MNKWIVICMLSFLSSPSVCQVSTVNGRDGNVVLNKSDVNLSNVDNTSDLEKPVSNPAQQALDQKVNRVGATMSSATLNGSTFNNGQLSGAVRADTPPYIDNSTRVATTAFAAPRDPGTFNVRFSDQYSGVAGLNTQIAAANAKRFAVVNLLAERLTLEPQTDATPISADYIDLHGQGSATVIHSFLNN